jgi:hypothetical protein
MISLSTNSFCFLHNLAVSASGLTVAGDVMCRREKRKAGRVVGPIQSSVRDTWPKRNIEEEGGGT